MKTLLSFVAVFISTFIFYNFAFAQNPIAPEMSLGGYGVPFLLTLIMGLVYKLIPAFSDRYKAFITMGVAIILAILALFYEPPEVINFKVWIETLVGGFFIGCQAIGIYEGARAIYKPRE